MKLMRNIVIAALVCACCGCGRQDPMAKARHYAQTAQENSRAAAALYEKILSANESSGVRFAAAMVYYNRGDFDAAAAHLRLSQHPSAAKYLAIALYRSGDYTAALEACQDPGRMDDEFRYYHGLICEKLNLFDRALNAYRDIKGAAYGAKAAARISVIEKAVNPLKIEEIDPAVARILAQCPGQEQYPQAGALVLLSDEQAEVTADNKMAYRLHYIVRIFNERGKENFAEAPIEYDSTDEKVQLDFARTIRPDGTVLDVGSRHIRDVSKYLNFPLYSNARVFIISFPEITEGATIEYQVTIFRSQLINKKDFVIPLPIQMHEPILDSAFTLLVPAARAVNVRRVNERYNGFGADMSPAMSETKSTKAYRWAFKNVPQIIPEPYMPPVEEINPSLVISSFDNWQSIYDWWWQLAKDKIKPSPEIRHKVAELTRNAASERARLQAIHNFCSQKIRYVAVEYGQAGYEPHQAADIFQNKYGDCKDQAILLVTMLREAGFGAWPVLIPTRDSFDMSADFPSMLFNHCIAAVMHEGKLIFMDPTAETCSFGDLPSGDQDRTVLVIKENGFEIARTPLYDAQHNTVEQRVSLAIAADDAVTGERAITSHGAYDQAQRYWLLYTVPDVIKDTIAAKIQDISIGAVLDGYAVEHLDDLNKPLVLKYSFRGPEFLTPAGRLRILPGLASIDMSMVAKPARSYPVEFAMLDLKDIQTTIALPAGYTIRYIPDPIEEQNQWLSFRAGYSVHGNTLVFRQQARMLQRRIPQNEYPAYKQFIEQLGKRLKQRIVLERKDL